MKRYEKVALALGAPGLALGFYVSGCSLATETLLPLALAALALMAAAIAVVNRGWKEDTDEEVVLSLDLNGKEETK